MPKVLILLLLILNLGCATQNLEQDLTTQTFSNNSLQFYTSLALEFSNSLQEANDCATSEAQIQAQTGIQSCANEGSLETSLVNFSCEDVSDLRANAQVEQNFFNCQIPGENLQGIIALDLLWNGTELDAFLTSAGFFYNGFPQSFTNLNVIVDENSELVCSGILVTEGQVCNVIPNCQFCPL